MFIRTLRTKVQMFFKSLWTLTNNVQMDKFLIITAFINLNTKNDEISNIEG